MTEKERQTVIQAFYDNIPADISNDLLLKKIIAIPNKEERSIIAKYECDSEIDIVAFDMFGWKYPEGAQLSSIGFIKEVFIPLMQYMIDDNRYYYDAVAAFFEGDTTKCFKLLKKDIDKYIAEKDELDEDWFAYNYLIFKGAIPKLYDYILDKISKLNHSKGLPELIKATKIYYCNNDNIQLEKAASEALLLVPDSILAKELMAEVWYCNKRWNNTLAILEEVNNGYIYAEHERMFMLAWCKSKTRDRKGAIEYYKKCLEIAPMKQWARNNLAYEYYITHQYEKAEKEYKKCIDEKLNLKYACTGYVRTLSALGKIEKAEQFISNSPEKIYKVALDELKDAKKGKKKNHNKDYIEEASNEELTEISSIEHKSTFQFSKESILEDELEERLLAGTTVFGIPLKIFKRKGVYGRQWSFAGLGRIDLLAEDNDGNLYVIELKKDSGYDDAYTQTVKYVEWFEKSKYAKGKKVYGIICVNNPPQKLLNSVQKDDRIRLFEYRVSYSEIK